MAKPPKLIARKAPYQILWEITKDEIESLESIDESIFAKAEGKMKQWQEEGVIDFYRMDDHVRKIIDIKTTPKFKLISAGHTFRFHIARGAKKLDQIVIMAPVDEEEHALELTIEETKSALKAAKEWDLTSFYLNVLRLAEEEKFEKPCRANCIYALETLKLSKRPRSFSIQKAAAGAKNSQGYDFLETPDQRGLIIHLTSSKYLTHEAERKNFLKHLEGTIKSMRQTHKVKISKNYILVKLREASQGQEALGINFPLTIFAGFIRPLKKPVTEDKIVIKGSPEEDKPEDSGPLTIDQVPENYPGKGLLKLKVADDKMSASVLQFQVKWFDNPDYKLDVEWLHFELLNNKIIDLNPNLLKRVVENLSRARDINLITVAEGVLGTPPRDPKLVEIIPDVESTDPRQSNIHTVKAGEKIAHWIFEQPGIPGHNIFGEEIPPPEPEYPPTALGQGVEEKDHEYYATIEGLAHVDPKRFIVDVQKTYIVKGDVSLVTGNIEFDGKVVVTGDVRDNAVIKTTEGIDVKGAVTFAQLNSAGTIRVKGGIVNSTITTHKNLRAQFIENSNLNVQGTVVVDKSLLNCYVVAKYIKSTGKPGLVAGGTIYCSHKMLTNNLGFEVDNPTYIKMGIDWKVSMAMALNENRMERFKNFEDESYKSLQSLKQKSTAQLTDAHRESMKKFEAELKRIKRIIRRTRMKLNNLKSAEDSYNEESEITVLRILEKSPDIQIGASEVSIIDSYKAVKVNFRKRKGTHVQVIPDDFNLKELINEVDSEGQKKPKKQEEEPANEVKQAG